VQPRYNESTTRRTYPRRKVTFPMSYAGPDGSGRPAFGLNVSGGGLCMLTREPVLAVPGRRTGLIASLAGVRVGFEADIRWQEPIDVRGQTQYRLGLKIALIPDAEWDALMAFSLAAAGEGGVAAAVGSILSAQERDSMLPVEKQQRIAERLAEEGLPYRLVGRVKTPYSIYNKMRTEHKSFAQVMDVFGFRVVVQTVTQCYQALGIVHTTWPVVPGRFKDYISTPKQNDYRSIGDISRIQKTLWFGERLFFPNPISLERVTKHTSGISSHSTALPPQRGTVVPQCFPDRECAVFLEVHHNRDLNEGGDGDTVFVSRVFQCSRENFGQGQAEADERRWLHAIR